MVIRTAVRKLGKEGELNQEYQYWELKQEQKKWHQVVEGAGRVRMHVGDPAKLEPGQALYNYPLAPGNHKYMAG